MWLQELLPEGLVVNRWMKGEEISDDNISDCSILVCGGGEESFAAHCERRGFRYGVISLHDETLKNYMGYSVSQNCQFVVRDYLNPLLVQMLSGAGLSGKLLHLYPGLSNRIFAVSADNEPVDNPEYTWCFAGQPKSDRLEMLKCFDGLKRGQVVLTDQGFSEDHKKVTALNSKEYFSLLRNSLFTPCPLGWVNIETYRFYEALQAGSIPVVLKNASPDLSDVSYWEAKFECHQKPPFVQASTWDEARERCQYLIDSGKAPQVRQECIIFWQLLKEHWKRKLTSYFFDSW
ncbi:hypothetical protein [Synechococcus sp. A15-60]|uniref:hypothetical protein n=1 Tax=Synechococcus sp. A15-60 TaxID=1050655 RepID=UPI001CA45D96|nr:hypothetical protein [Synechococcus sp. A15-60]